MGNKTLKFCVEELEKADTYKEISKAMVEMREFCENKKSREIWKAVVAMKGFCANKDSQEIDADISLEILNSLGPKFVNLLRNDTVIDGERPEVVKGTLITVLSWFTKDEKFATHEKMIQVLPYIGKILTTFNDCHGEVCTKMIKESYKILKAISQHPVGMDEIIEYNVVNDLCFAAGAMKFGSSYAEQLLLDIIQSEHNDTWNYNNTDGVNYLVTRYVELIGQDDEIKWHYIDVLKVFLYSWDTCMEYPDWSSTLRPMLASLLYTKLHNDNRSKLLELFVVLITIYDLNWIVDEGFAFLLRVVHSIALEVYQTLDGRTSMQSFAETSLPGYYRVLCQILDHLLLPDNQLNNEECGKIYDAMTIAMNATCGFMKRLYEHDRNCKSGETESKPAKSKECIHQDSPESPNKPDTENNSTCKPEPSGRWYNRHCHTLIDRNFDSCSELPDEEYLLFPMLMLVKWYLSSQKVPSKTVIGAIPYLLKLSRYAVGTLQNERRQIAPGDFKSPIDYFWDIVRFFYDLIDTRESTICLLQAQLPCLLEEYLDYHWHEFNRAQGFIRDATSKLPKLADSEMKDEAAPNTKPNAGQNRDADLFLRRAHISEEKLKSLMEILIFKVLEKIDNIGNEWCQKLWKFSITNLLYFEANDELVITAFHVMAMGLVAYVRLASANLTPSESVAKPFLEACLHFLGGVYETDTQKGKPCSIQFTPRFQKPWAAFEKFYVICMRAIPKCLAISPSLSELIVETDWDVNILKMLKDIDSKKLEEWQINVFDAVLSSTASNNTALKRDIRQNSGMLIARELHLPKLRGVLSSRAKVTKTGKQ